MRCLISSHDPLCIPHRYSDREDIEVAAFFAATLAWGNRSAIVKSLNNLMERMDNAPGAFVRHHAESDLNVLDGFVYRIFQSEDARGFVRALSAMLKEFGTLEQAFLAGWKQPEMALQLRQALASFHVLFMSQHGVADRTRKHIANPNRGSAAKRLNMYLRWMVRSSQRGVDLGLWTSIKPCALHIPLDVHTSNVGRKLGLLSRKSNDWLAVEELTSALRMIDPVDPVRLDFALFGLGAIEGF